VLAAIVLLWVAGRVLAMTPYAIAAIVVDAAFPMAVAAGIAVPLVRSGNRRNYFFMALLVVLGVASVAMHVFAAQPTLDIVLDLVIFIMAVMGGRVIPMFTNNGVPGTKARRFPALEKVALGGVLVLAIADAVAAPPIVLIVMTATLAIVHGWRLALWQPWRTLRTPLVWILHASYLWIVVHFALRALAVANLVPEPIAVHALTIGAIGGLTIGMMTRTSRGHTGRPLIAERADVACYALVMAAAILRVGGALLLPGAYVATVIAAGACWSAGFAIYAVAYAPHLVRARLDGKPG
jgi:uncharacterized protein involved in response to NO